MDRNTFYNNLKDYEYSHKYMTNTDYLQHSEQSTLLGTQRENVNYYKREGEPGHYEDKGLQYKEAIAILNACSYDGYINSEFEGQRSQQDMGYEGLVDEVEQVRRHHEMMNRFINDHSKDITI